MIEIRQARDEDLADILTIYNDVIVKTTAVYRDEPVDLAERRVWFDGRVKHQLPVLVATSHDTVVGFSSFGPFRPSPCYRHTVEHTVHVAADARRKGVASRLISALLPLASERGAHVMVGVIDAENAGSIELHHRLGFERVAHLHQVGRKFGRWLDLVFMQKILG